MTESSRMTEAEQWLSREDEVCRTDRVERLKWLATELPQGEYLTFPGGLMAKFLFEETRYCFAYGQYLAVIFRPWGKTLVLAPLSRAAACLRRLPPT